MCRSTSSLKTGSEGVIFRNGIQKNVSYIYEQTMAIASQPVDTTSSYERERERAKTCVL